MRGLLRDLSLSYAETVSKPRLVIPVYEAAGAILLWDDPNPWRSAWETRDADDGSPVPLILPRGDRGDIFAIGATQVLSGDVNRLGAIARRYGVEDVLVAHAVLRISSHVLMPHRISRFGLCPHYTSETARSFRLQPTRSPHA